MQDMQVDGGVESFLFPPQPVLLVYPPVLLVCTFYQVLPSLLPPALQAASAARAAASAAAAAAAVITACTTSNTPLPHNYCVNTHTSPTDSQSSPDTPEVKTFCPHTARTPSPFPLSCRLPLLHVQLHLLLLLSSVVGVTSLAPTSI
jgi:hypothetical protein